METYLQNHSSTVLNLSEIVLGLRKIQKISAQKSKPEFKTLIDSLTQRDMQTLRILTRLTIDEGRSEGVALKLIQESLHINKASASVIISHLVSKGLVSSKDNPNNRRSKLIKLSEYGKENISNILGRCNELFNEFSSNISSEDMETFNRVVAQIHHNVYSQLDQSAINDGIELED